jgi:CxxC-x17-CxxC domain-containing protein
MEPGDLVSTCRDCQRSFTFTPEERTEFHQLGFTNTPSRCADCRAERKSRQEQFGGRRPPPGFRERRGGQFAAVCAACGKQTMLPFAPVAGRPTYCSPCFERRRTVDAEV